MRSHTSNLHLHKRISRAVALKFNYPCACLKPNIENALCCLHSCRELNTRDVCRFAIELSAEPRKHRAIVKSAEDLNTWAGIEAEVKL